jgi:serine/threonine-protein kinase RIO1
MNKYGIIRLLVKDWAHSDLSGFNLIIRRTNKIIINIKYLGLEINK